MQQPLGATIITGLVMQLPLAPFVMQLLFSMLDKKGV